MSEKEYEMNYKRALKLMRMPEGWFNTSEKAELRNKAIGFLNNNPEFATTIKTIVHGKVTDHDYDEGRESYSRALQGSEKLQEAEATLSEAKENNGASLKDSIFQVMDYGNAPLIMRRVISDDRDTLFFEPRDPKTGETQPFLQGVKEYLSELADKRTEEKEKKDKSIKRRIAKVFSKIRGKEVEPTPEEVLLADTETVIAKIDDILSKQKLVEETKATCFRGVTEKEERYDSAIRNLMHLLGYDEQDLHDKEVEVFHDPNQAKDNLKARFESIASKAYHLLPKKDEEFKAVDTKNRTSYKTNNMGTTPRFDEFDEIDRE